VVFVSGHLSNWEVMPAAIVDSGVACEMTYRAANNPYVDKRSATAASATACACSRPRAATGRANCCAGMNAGRSVALMNDQKFNSGVAATVLRP
jgi:KDO2-lipid IV(A) lauroyltransferase